MAKVTLHRCRFTFIHNDMDHCWKVQKALDDQGIEYEIVKGPLRRGKRDELEKLSGQRQYPVLELPDGEVYRAESDEMAARIATGGLGRAGGAL